MELIPKHRYILIQLLLYELKTNPITSIMPHWVKYVEEGNEHGIELIRLYILNHLK